MKAEFALIRAVSGRSAGRDRYNAFGFDDVESSPRVRLDIFTCESENSYRLFLPVHSVRFDAPSNSRKLRLQSGTPYWNIDSRMGVRGYSSAPAQGGDLSELSTECVMIVSQSGRLSCRRFRLAGAFVGKSEERLGGAEIP
jgi:hypothetical protein